jgi:hypothetical protein
MVDATGHVYYYLNDHMGSTAVDRWPTIYESVAHPAFAE